MQAFTAAVVGTGFIGPVHVEGLRRAGVHVAGILGSSVDKSLRAAEALQLARGYADLEEILADDSVDCVHIASPNRLHFEQAAAVLRAGKHVLCEKPLALNSTESAELVRLAEQAGVAAGVAYNIRFYPLCHEVAGQLRSGAAGRLLHVQGSYVQDWLLRPDDFNWRVLAQEAGPLRAIADIGTHWLDLIQFLVDEPVVAVCADLRTVHAERLRPAGGVQTFTNGAATKPDVEAGAEQRRAVAIDTEDCGSVLLKFASGANGNLWVSQTTAGRKNCLRFEIATAEQTFSWNSELPNQLEVGHRERPNQQLLRDPALLGALARPYAQYPGGHNEGFPDTFKQLFRCFYGAIATGTDRARAAYPTFADGHREVLLCEAILQSHQQRRWIDVGEAR